MAGALADLDLDRFTEQLEAVSRDLVPSHAYERLWIHYRELRRWNSRLSLIGAGTAADVLTRHYAESLEALPLLEAAVRAVDVGSGAGFPGLVLAAARPELEVWLVEARQRKATFLATAADKASLSCRVLNARVGALLPEAFPHHVDLITIRALRLEPVAWESMAGSLVETGRILRWVGPKQVPVPGGFSIARRRAIPGSERSIEELTRV